MKKIILTILLFVLCINNTDAQWIKSNSPAGANITAISKTDERVYVATAYEELYFSQINASNKYQWELMNFKTSENINDIIQIENKLYVGTDNGIYISTNDGQDWVLENFGYEYFFVNKFKYVNNTLYLATNRGVSISTDDGATWEHFKLYEGDTEPERGHSVNSMDVKNDTIVATYKGSSNYPSKGSCVWVSYDAGTNWTDMTTGDIPIKQINSEAIVGNTVFIATTYGVYKSLLKEIKWSKVSGLDDNDYKDIQYDGKRLYVVTSNGYLSYSEDEGAQWSYHNPYTTIKPTDYYPEKILRNKKDIILTTTVGLLKTSDGGGSWYEINDGLNSLGFSDIEIKNDEMFLCSSTVGVFSSIDSGTSWSDFNTGLKKKNIVSLCKTDDVLYAGESMPGQLNMTTDNGQNWELLSKFLPRAYYFFIKEYKNYLFISAQKSGFYRVSKDGSIVDTISYDDKKTLWITNFSYGEAGIFIASHDDGILFSHDDGLSWASISDNISEKMFYAIAYSDGVLIAGSGTGKLYKTTDMGANWDMIYQTPTDIAYISNIKIETDNVFFSTHINIYNNEGLVVKSEWDINVIKTNGGKCVNISDNMAPIHWVSDLEIYNDSIFILNKGIYKAAISDFENVGVIDGDPLTGNYLYAYPPYPLPAKETVNTLIYWDTKLNIHNAEMGVYNFLGAKVCGKEHITLSQNSSYSGIVTWDATGTPPGIYFLQIRHGTRTEAIKMLIE